MLILWLQLKFLFSSSSVSMPLHIEFHWHIYTYIQTYIHTHIYTHKKKKMNRIRWIKEDESKKMNQRRWIAMLQLFHYLPIIQSACTSSPPIRISNYIHTYIQTNIYTYTYIYTQKKEDESKKMNQRRWIEEDESKKMNRYAPIILLLTHYTISMYIFATH